MTHAGCKQSLLGLAALCFAITVASCSEPGGPHAETETHFLSQCSDTCAGDLSCICGVCTRACDDDDSCGGLHASATCSATPAVCTHSAGHNSAGRACDMHCDNDADCVSLGDDYACAAGVCRAQTQASGGSGGAGATSGGVGGATAGAGGAGASGASGGASGGAGGASGANAGSGGDAGVVATDAGEIACDSAGDPCCGATTSGGFCSFPLRCDLTGHCVDCACVLGGFAPVCGFDGLEYDAICGRVCVDVEIECEGQCPCECGATSATGCGANPPGTGAACCNGLVCCEGVPYDPAGQCEIACNFESDRNIKMDIQPVDSARVLKAVSRLPIQAWRYRTQPEAQHLGPMAQDFAAELGLGADDRVIAAVDASGVALAAIQALNARVEHLAQINESLVGRIAALEAEREATQQCNTLQAR